MSVDNTTTNFGWQLPNAANELAHDVVRLANAISAIDTELALYPTTTETNAAIAAAIAAIIDSAPGTLDTLNELSAALGDDPNFATSMSNLIGTKLGLGGGILTGLLTIAAAGLKLQNGAAPGTNGSVTLVDGAIQYMRGGNVCELLDTQTAQTAVGKTFTSPTINGGTLAGVNAGASVKDATGTNQNLGYMGIPAKTAKTQAYTLQLEDAFFEVPSNSAITIPANSVTAFPVGTMIAIRNTAAGTITIGITTDTLTQEGTTNTGTRTLARNGIAVLRKIGTTSWLIMGGHVT